MDRRSLAICAIFKDEAPYLLEWIAYHRVIGFDRFVLYDNGSTDGGADLIRRSPLADRVTVIHWPQRPGQLTAYRHFIDIFAPAYDWAAFIDLDEFILPLDGNTLHGVLDSCRNASAVMVNWRVFGPAGHEEPVTGLVIAAYDLRAEDALPVNRHVKSIVRCADLLDVTQNPHEFRLKGPVSNPLGQEVPNIALQPTACHQGMVINHYYTKSRREWLSKLHRGDPIFDQSGPKYTEDVFDHLAAACHVKDDTIKAYIPQIRALLGEDAAELPMAPPASSAAVVTGPEPAAPADFVLTEPEMMPNAAVWPASASAEAPTNPAPPQPHAPPDRGGAVWQAQPGSSLVPEPAQPWGAAMAQVAQASPPCMSAWKTSGPDAQEHLAGLALVFCDRSRPAAPWLAALRGRAAGLTDPEFLQDETGRLRDFDSDREARSACEALLAEYQLG